jgi:hypothetical protein
MRTYLVHMLNLIHESYIKRNSHILEKTPPTTPPPARLRMFSNNPLSHNLPNSIEFEIDGLVPK